MLHRLAPALLTLLLALLLPLVAAAQDEPDTEVIDARSGSEELHTCFVTGEAWNGGPQRIEAVFREAGKLKRAHFLNLGYFVYALIEFEKQGRALSVHSVSVVDYATLGTPNEHLVEVDRDSANVWFVHTDKKVGEARAPYVYAFASREAADEFKAQQGGKVLEYADALTRLAKQYNAASAEAESEFAKELMN